jgi:formate dehydrogenase assembly factor FdhD
MPVAHDAVMFQQFLDEGLSGVHDIGKHLGVDELVVEVVRRGADMQ